MDTYGRHVLADLSKCSDIEYYDNEENLKALLKESALAANATVLAINIHKFEPIGISGLVFFAESHMSCHLYPEKGYISFDCFTCSELTDPENALAYFASKVGAEVCNNMLIDRGNLM